MQTETAVVNYRSVLCMVRKKRYASGACKRNHRILVIFNQVFLVLPSLYLGECSEKVIEDSVKYAGKCTRTKEVWRAAICQQPSTMKKIQNEFVKKGKQIRYILRDRWINRG